MLPDARGKQGDAEIAEGRHEGEREHRPADHEKTRSTARLANDQSKNKKNHEGGQKMGI